MGKGEAKHEEETEPPAEAFSYADVCKLALELPEVEESTSYGTPALKVRGKLMGAAKGGREFASSAVRTLDDRARSSRQRRKCSI